jgi:hypothetical protein
MVAICRLALSRKELSYFATKQHCFAFPIGSRIKTLPFAEGCQSGAIVSLFHYKLDALRAIRKLYLSWYGVDSTRIDLAMCLPWSPTAYRLSAIWTKSLVCGVISTGAFEELDLGHSLVFTHKQSFILSALRRNESSQR